MESQDQESKSEIPIDRQLLRLDSRRVVVTAWTGYRLPGLLIGTERLATNDRLFTVRIDEMPPVELQDAFSGRCCTLSSREFEDERPT